MALLSQKSMGWTHRTTIVFGLVSAPVLALSVGCSDECKGKDLDKTIDALDALQQDGLACGYMFNTLDALGDLLTCVEQAAARAKQRRKKLTDPCKEVYDDVVEGTNAGSGDTSSGTSCVGGVCCDSTGCYD